MFVLLVCFLWATVFQLVLLVERLKVEGALEQDIKDSYSVKFVLALQGMFLNRKIGMQMFILLIGFFLAGIGLLAVVYLSSVNCHLCSACFVCWIAIPLYFCKKNSVFEPHYGGDRSDGGWATS